MRRIKEKINNLSIWKKFILYTYIVLLPILAVICICVASFRYMTTKENYQQFFPNVKWIDFTVPGE